MNNERLQGWTLCPLGDVCQIIGGSQPPKKQFIYAQKEGYTRLIQIRDYKSNNHLTFIPRKSARRFCSKDDVMIGRYGPPLFQILRGLEGAYNVALMKAVPINEEILNNNFLFYLLQDPPLRNYIIQSSERTVGQDGVRKDLLETYEIKLPPFNEQDRIVKKIVRILPKVQTCQERLEKIPRILKRFRQSVLAAACSGYLTADWRKEHPQVCDTSELLREVKAQRLARHKSECQEAKQRGQKAPKIEWNEDNPNFDEYVLMDLPDSWLWSHVSMFGFVRGGKRLPKGETLVDENTGHPYLRIKDLKDGTVDRSEIRFVPSHVFPRICNYTIRHGDVYLTIVGSIGDAGTIPTDFDGANLTENAAKIVQPSGLVPEFLVFWFRSSTCQRIIRQNIYSGGQGKLALFRIEQLPVPFAPFAEQQEIVRRVEDLFKLADQIEARYQKAKANVEKLTQSILAKAFRGELVSQDPNDEPASALLERIKKTKDMNFKRGIKNGTKGRRNLA